MPSTWQDDLPDAVRRLIAERRWPEAAAVDVSPRGRLARGRLFLRCGREAEATSDFAALSEAGDLGAAAAIERALVSLHGGGPPEQVRVGVEKVLAEADLSDLTRARALLARGIVEHRLDRWQRALRDLIDGLTLAERAGDIGSRVDLQRAIGVVHAWRGRHSQAVLHLTLALADCAVLGDTLLLAELLGELGRVNLEMRRHAHALELFRRQQEVAAGALDDRAAIRLRLAMVQALIGLGSYEEAAGEAAEVLEAAEARGLSYLAFVAARDLALAYLRGGRLDAALAAIDRARRHVPADPDSYECLALDGVQAELDVSTGSPDAEAAIARVVAAWSARDLVGPEIDARLLEADLLQRRGATAAAEQTLRIALGRARSNGLSLLEDCVRETMVRLDVREGLVSETGRPVAASFTDAGHGYVLLEKLGSGRFGSVFRAFDLERGREVALKRMTAFDRYDSTARLQVLESARTEFEVAARVSHPGLARVMALGETSDGGIYVVQEFIAGPSLREMMADPSSAGLRTVTATLWRIALALAALHHARVVHRDVKPDNVLCPTPDRPVLVDLGIAAFAQEAAGLASRGTEGYAAPEQWRREASDARADLYSLGVIAFEWLTGRPPIRKPADPPPRRRRREALDEQDCRDLTAAVRVPPLVDLIAALLDHDPQCRPVSAEDVGVRLKTVLASL
jgi:tetratricopeptide (TPR) repeat protein